MKHQKHKEKSGPNSTTDHKIMDHSKMSHGSNPIMGHEGHKHLAMIDDFKKRFYVVLLYHLL